MTYQPKLSNLQASRLIVDLSNGMRQKDVAEKYGISVWTVRRIKNDPTRGETKRELQPCGTPAAYRRHQKAGEVADEACLKAWAKDNARFRKPGKPRAPLKPCGTLAAYRRHMAKKERACKPCREVRNEYMRGYMKKWRAERKAEREALESNMDGQIAA